MKEDEVCWHSNQVKDERNKNCEWIFIFFCYLIIFVLKRLFNVYVTNTYVYFVLVIMVFPYEFKFLNIAIFNVMLIIAIFIGR